MHRVLIVADDLSGAADCGAAWVRAGLTAVVSLSTPLEEIDADVLSLDADTRGMTAGAAAERVYHLTRLYALSSPQVLFKKIDSTLRGHPGPEIAAMLRARRETVPDVLAIVAPAFPAAGRTTHQGMHYLHGMPLHESDIWRREKMSGEAHIPSMLARSGLRCEHIDLQSLRGEQGPLLKQIRSASEAADVIVFDAVTADDLGLIAEVAASLGERALWVGSAGLAQHLVRACDLRPEAKVESQQLPTPHGPVLIVIGSASRRSQQQISELLMGSSIHGIVIPPEALLGASGSSGWMKFAAELSDALKQGEDVLLTCGAKPEVEAERRCSLSQALGEMTAVACGRVGALVASGGETARNVLDRWGVCSLELLGELEEGVPISSAVVNQSGALTVITKAGDFGQPTTLLHCYEWLTHAREK